MTARATVETQANSQNERTTRQDVSTLELLLARYGALLDSADLAEILGFASAKQVTNALASHRLRLQTGKIGGRRKARIQDVAAYIDDAFTQPKPDSEPDLPDWLDSYRRWAK